MKVNCKSLQIADPPQHVLDNFKKQLGDGKISVNNPGAWSDNAATLYISPEGERKMMTRAEKEELLQKSIHKLPPRQIYPNNEINTKLNEGLSGADDNTKIAAWDIINNDLNPHNVGDMSEEERKERIALGLEKAKYLSESMEPGKKEAFMDAMNSIAKYGLNGKLGDDGKVSYDIRWGRPTTSEVIQALDSDTYKRMNEYLAKGVNVDTEEGRANLRKGFEIMSDWCAVNHYEIENYEKEQENMEASVKNTKVESPYKDVDHTDKKAFMDSILMQSKHLSSRYLTQNLQEFFSRYFDK